MAETRSRPKWYLEPRYSWVDLVALFLIGGLIVDPVVDTLMKAVL